MGRGGSTGRRDQIREWEAGQIAFKIWGTTHSGPQVWDFISLNESDELIGLITFDYGVGAHGSLSGNTVHPATAAVLPGGPMHGPAKVRETIYEGENYVSRYRYEDQLGSLIGVADAGGAKVDEYRYLEYGSAIHRPIAFDGAAALVSSATHDEPAAGTSEIVLDDDYLLGIDLTGKELVVSIPNDPVDAYRVARVVRNTSDTIWINDPGTYSAGDAIDAGRDFVVYDFEGSVQEASVDFAVSSTNYPGSPDETEVQCDAYEHALGWSAVGETGGAIVVGAISGYAYIFPGDQTENFLVTMTYQVTPPGHSVTKGTGGEWTGAPTYASSETTFTDSGADFQAYMVGWLLQPDVELPSYLEIVEVDESSGNWVRVKGDADTLASAGSTYRIHAPPGVDRATGALFTGLEESGSHWLWAGYEYVPPLVGFHNPEGQDPGNYGAQPGTNKLGSYHCWNRVYDIHTGRWTTPDPAMTPWHNLCDYVSANSTHQSDTNGLGSSSPPSSPPQKEPLPTDDYTESHVNDPSRRVRTTIPVKDDHWKFLTGMEIGDTKDSYWAMHDGEKCRYWWELIDISSVGWLDMEDEVLLGEGKFVTHSFQDARDRFQAQLVAGALINIIPNRGIEAFSLFAESDDEMIRRFRGDVLRYQGRANVRITDIQVTVEWQLLLYTMVGVLDIFPVWAKYRQCPCEAEPVFIEKKREHRRWSGKVSWLEMYSRTEIKFTYEYKGRG